MRTGACCFSTSARRSGSARWKHCELQLEEGEGRLATVTASRGTRHHSPVGAGRQPSLPRVHLRIRKIASARRWRSGDPRQDFRTAAGSSGPARRDAHSASGSVYRRGRRVDAMRNGWLARVGVTKQRWRPHGILTNAEVSGALLRRKFRPEATAMEPLRTALDRGLLGVRRRAARCGSRGRWPNLAGQTHPGRRSARR